MDVIQIKVNSPRFRPFNTVVIRPVNIIEQNKLSQVRANHFDDLDRPGTVFSITPVLLMVGARAPLMGQHKASPSAPGPLIANQLFDHLHTHSRHSDLQRIVQETVREFS